MEGNTTAILILNYNCASETMDCIQSIEACNTAPVKYIVVDNASSKPGETDLLDQFFSQSNRSYRRFSDSDNPEKDLPYYTFVCCCKNVGYAQGNNKGLAFAYEDPSIRNILILNSDILFSEDILPTLIRFQQQRNDAGLITPLIVSRKCSIDHCCARNNLSNWDIILLFALFQRNPFGMLSPVFRRQRILLNNPALLEHSFFPVELVSGACMLIDKALFQRIGGFDPNTFLYYEENILFKKLQSVSRISYCVPSVKCTHLGAGSTQHSPSAFLQQCNLDSAGYYLTHYGQMSVLQRIAWPVVKGAWRLKFMIKGTRKTA